MVDYKIVKYCGLCKKRFVVPKGENKKIYCDECYIKISASNKAEREAQEKADIEAAEKAAKK